MGTFLMWFQGDTLNVVQQGRGSVKPVRFPYLSEFARGGRQANAFGTDTIRLRCTFASSFFGSAHGGSQNRSQLITNAIREFLWTGEEINKLPTELLTPELCSIGDINQF